MLFEKITYQQWVNDKADPKKDWDFSKNSHLKASSAWEFQQKRIDELEKELETERRLHAETTEAWQHERDKAR